MIFKNWLINDILFLTYVKGLNNSNIKKIVDSYSSLNDFLNSDSNILIPSEKNSLFDYVQVYSDAADKQLESCYKNSVQLTSVWDDNYPSLLKNITGAPIILFFKGTLKSADSISISIVGTRSASVYGKLTTERFADYFSANNLIVTSGLAYGIDSQAHSSTIKSNGTTYAVIASGIDQIGLGSAAVKSLSDKIIDSGGCIISEYKCGVKALPVYFPQRNRIISGISIATVVIESGIKGGSIITARFAFDQQREVFAVPGNINSEKSKGTNNLIFKNMATIAVSPEDVLKSLGLNTEFISHNHLPKNNFNEKEKLLLSIINFEPKHIDEICNDFNSDMSELLVLLLELEFKGIIRQLPGKYYIRN